MTTTDPNLTPEVAAAIRLVAESGKEVLAEAVVELRRFAAAHPPELTFIPSVAEHLNQIMEWFEDLPLPVRHTALRVARAWLAGSVRSYCETAPPTPPGATESPETAPGVPSSTPQGSGVGLGHPPEEVYRAVAEARVRRWGYPADVEAGMFDEWARQPDLRAEVDLVWRLARVVRKDPIETGAEAALGEAEEKIRQLQQAVKRLETPSRMLERHTLAAERDAMQMAEQLAVVTLEGARLRAQVAQQALDLHEVETARAYNRHLALLHEELRRVRDELHESRQRECTALCKDVEEDRDRLARELALRCPTCGPTSTEPHPRREGVVRCVNCKEHLPVGEPQ